MSSEAQTYTVRLRERGQVTIPRDVRQQLSAQEGDVLTLLQIGDLILLTQRQLRTPALAEQFMAKMEEAGVSLADLLSGLVEERNASARNEQGQQ